MCFGCTASSTYWDAAGEDEHLESPEELNRKKLDMLRDSLHAGPVRLEEERSAGQSTVGFPQE